MESQTKFPKNKPKGFLNFLLFPKSWNDRFFDFYYFQKKLEPNIIKMK
jgi:hypothetical protein